jgi:coenzyme F420-dependent glucose-6-phosphate dehydrogenase
MAVAESALGDPDQLELGYWLSSEEHPPSALVAHAGWAEQAGLRVAMISDHFSPWIPAQRESGFVWSVLGGIATATKKLCVGTGVSAPVHRQHPLAIAHAAATVELMMPGRFFLGLGTGERLNEQVMGRRWPTAKERRAMLREAIEVIRRLWAGDLVSHAGEHFTVERARLQSRPDLPPPIVVAAGGKKTARLAGEVADGVLGVAPDATVVDAFEASAGRGKPRFAQLSLCWAHSEDEARTTVRECWPNAAFPGPLRTELALPSQFGALADAMPDEAKTEGVPCGPDPEVHAAAVKELVASGFSTVLLHQIGPDQRGFLDFYRRELQPRLTTG